MTLTNLSFVMKKLTFYTDGSTAPGNPGPSGYGFYGRDDGLLIYSGYGPVGMSSTNNVAEIMAIHNLVQYLLNENIIGDVTIYSDSEYAITILRNIDDKARNNWKTLIGSPMANQQQWIALHTAIDKYKSLTGPLTFKWVKGHNGTYEN
jgi:ribonuclease HI